MLLPYAKVDKPFHKHPERQGWTSSECDYVGSFNDPKYGDFDVYTNGHSFLIVDGQFDIGASELVVAMSNIEENKWDIPGYLWNPVRMSIRLVVAHLVKCYCEV